MKKIHVSYSGGGFYVAVVDGEYDGAPDSGNRNVIGSGKTKDEAVADLIEVYNEHYEIELMEGVDYIII